MYFALPQRDGERRLGCREAARLEGKIRKSHRANNSGGKVGIFKK